jgi:hypothetical protein
LEILEELHYQRRKEYQIWNLIVPEKKRIFKD